MGYNLDKYRDLINKSPLFSLDKETQQVAYKRESLKMVEYLYCYLMEKKPKEYEEYALEITECAEGCIKRYDPQKVNAVDNRQEGSDGPFLRYFNAAWKKKYGNIEGEQALEAQFKGIHFTDEEKRAYKKFKVLTRDKYEKENQNQIIADLMGLTLKEVEALEIMENQKTVSDIATNEDGEEYSLSDRKEGRKTADGDFIELEGAKGMLDHYEEVFDRLQGRQKALLSRLITKHIQDDGILQENEELLNHFKLKSYFDEEFYEESLQRDTPIQAKEIAELFGVKEASLSRTWKEFKEKLKAADKDLS